MIEDIIAGVAGAVESIFQAFLDAAQGLLEGVIDLLPDVETLPLPLASEGLFLMYGWANTFLPLAEVLDIVLMIVGLWLTIGTVQVARVIYEYWPFKAT